MATDNWKENLLRSFKSLVATDVHRALDACYSAEIFSDNEKEKVERCKTSDDKNRQFLMILLRKSEAAYRIFLQCLKTDSAVHSNAISIIMETDASQPQIYEEYQDAIQLRRKIYCNLQTLVEDTDLKDITDDFISWRIFDIDDLEKISNINLTTNERNTQFLNTLLKKKTCGYHLLMSELRRYHADLVQIIEKTVVAEELDKEIEAHIQIVDLERKGAILTAKDLETIKMNLHPEEISPGILKAWTEDEKTFYPTVATTQILETIESKKNVIASGLPGAGKTAIIHYIALKLKKDGYKLCYVQTFNEIKCKINKFGEEEKQIFVIDDMFGVHGIDEVKRKQWCVDNKDDLERCLNNNNIRILCSSRLQVIQDPKLKNIKSSFTIVNISEGEIELSKDERAGIFRNHAITKQRNDLLTENKDQLKVEIMEKVREVECPVGCFPLVCHLYTGDRETKQTIEEYFNKPLDVIADHLKELEVEDRLSHFCLLLCLIYENNLPINIMKVGKETEETKNKREELLEICNLPVSTPRKEIRDKMDTLLQTFVKREDDTYQFVHDIVHDAVIKHICGLSSDVLEVILSHCEVLLCVACDRGCDTNVIQALIDAGADVNTRYVDGDTALMLSVARLNYKTTQLLLDHKADVNLRNMAGFSALHVSVVIDDYEKTQLLLDHKADVSLCDTIGRSALHWSVAEGHCKTTQLLLSHEANVNLCDENGMSALHVSVDNGHYETTLLLLEHQANANLCDKDGVSTLYLSVFKGQYETTQLLLMYGADVNPCNKNGWSALHLSVDIDDYEMTQLLLEHGANVNQCDKDGVSTLYLSVRKGQYETTQLLIIYGAEVNQCNTNGCTALYMSVYNGHYEITQLLLENKADVNQCTKNNFSPLYMSVYKGHYKTTQLLLDHKADVKQCNKEGRTVLYLSVALGDYETTKLLLEHEVDVNQCTKNKWSALYMSAYKGHIQTTQLLLEYKANVNHCNRNGRPALCMCADKGHYETTQLLLENGANVNQCDKELGVPALHLSVARGHYKTTQLLMQHKADVNLCNKDGTSALYISVYNGDYETTHLLLDYKADVNQSTKDGVAPLYLSVAREDYETTQLLLDYKADVNQSDMNGESALYLSQIMQNDTITELLQSRGAVCVYKGAQYNHVTDIPDLPLCDLVQYNNYQTVKLLIERGANINDCHHEYDWSALFMSQLMEHENITSLLLSRDAMCLYKGKYYKHITEIQDCEVHDDDYVVLVGGRFVFVKERIQDLKEKKPE